ncbi:adenosylcobinamide amidohydrolase [Salinisphaera sp.]|uniref:adenosylcobinamide amidohydrolase n=1 Tax=Salinisphaera sp. TaxID=1914330 RepID=UPI002D7755DC|nr:adenosylcobinamide amidohydrolase [Salinisphaera sp.]HET7314136.1 adenosylcobinamide amidohydrolase [Salinisphaera sp.]
MAIVADVADRPWRALSSAPAGGGLTMASAWFNAHVRHDAPLDPAGPAAVLARLADERGLPGDRVAMMTGAAMTSLRLAAADIEGERFAVALTAGLANARAAGDAADERRLHGRAGPPGTINIALFSSARLTDAALVETVGTVAEARAAALAEAGVGSAVSGRSATGTGTDATAVFCAPAGRAVEYTGKHTIVGETVARLVMTALAASIAGARCVGNVESTAYETSAEC